MNDANQIARKQSLEQLVGVRRKELLARLREAIRDHQHGRSEGRGAVLDEGDASQGELETGIFFSVLQLAAGDVADGEAALRRLDEGRYGVCDRCGEPISEARLRAMPFARRCTPCEDERDRERTSRSWDSRLSGEPWR